MTVEMSDYPNASTRSVEAGRDRPKLRESQVSLEIEGLERSAQAASDALQALEERLGGVLMREGVSVGENTEKDVQILVPVAERLHSVSCHIQIVAERMRNITGRLEL